VSVLERAADIDLRSDRQSGRMPILLMIVSAVLIGFTWWVSARIWNVAGQSAPIIDQLVGESGGSLSPMQWYDHAEAKQIFCLHPDGVAVANRFGRYVDGGVLYVPALILKIFASLGALLIAGVTTQVLSRRWAAPLLVVTVASGLALLAPLVVYWETIEAVSNIVE